MPNLQLNSFRRSWSSTVFRVYGGRGDNSTSAHDSDSASRRKSRSRRSLAAALSWSQNALKRLAIACRYRWPRQQAQNQRLHRRLYCRIGPFSGCRPHIAPCNMRAKPAAHAQRIEGYPLLALPALVPSTRADGLTKRAFPLKVPQSTAPLIGFAAHGIVSQPQHWAPPDTGRTSRHYFQ